jgi:hypothetical protein
MKNMVKTRIASTLGVAAVALAIIVSMAGLPLTGCSSPTGGSNQTPTADDYDIVGLMSTASDGAATVTVTPKKGKSSGKITIFYEGIDGTVYAKSNTPPTALGIYDVTFDVAAASGWNAVKGLKAGTLAIGPVPIADDFTFGNLAQYAGSVTAVTITAKAGKSPGEITVYYAGSKTLPQTAGSYAVTFDVAATDKWNVAKGLSAGTLSVVEGQAPTADDFEIGKLTQYAGAVEAVSIKAKDDKSSGAVTIYYAGSATIPQTAGTYAVTFDVAATDKWAPATGLSAGTLNVLEPQTPVAGDYEIGNLEQLASGVTAVTIKPRDGKSPGAVTIYYADSADIPQTVGTYAVTFDVAEALTDGWKAATGLSAGTLTVDQSGAVRIVFFWIDEHEQLATGNSAAVDGKFYVYGGESIIFTAQDYNASNQYRWELNGTNTGDTSGIYTFNQEKIGKHTVGLLVKKDGKWYSTNFDIIVQ